MMATIELTDDELRVVRQALLRERNRCLGNSNNQAFKPSQRLDFYKRSVTLENVIFDSMPRPAEVTS